MPSLDWLKTRFSYGFDSGDIEANGPDERRDHDERISGGSYLEIFNTVIKPIIKPDSTILELGPGRGSWTRAVLNNFSYVTVHTVDYVDVSQWLDESTYPGRLFCHRVEGNSFDCIEDLSIDLFFSIGVLCHNEDLRRREILKNVLPKVKSGGRSLHQYGAWDKLDSYGWKRGGVPEEFKEKPDEEIWWPRNSIDMMRDAAVQTGWNVINADIDLLKRDGIIIMEKQ